MIYVTGDTHGDLDMSKVGAKNWEEGKSLTADDYLIVCGDFGLIWDPPHQISAREQAWTHWLEDKPWTTLFLDGNHENFPRINSYPVIEKFGGKVHKISDKIFHLMRGEYYTIQDHTFWVMGGARSHDKMYRTEGESWWPEEMPTYAEMNYGIDNLRAHDMKVDFILTHCAPRKIQEQMASWYEADDVVAFLNIVYADVDFQHWYCGHYHMDAEWDEKFTSLYNRIVKIV